MLVQPGLPVTNASEHYVYQAANTATALTEGRLWPRWAPHALAGYGAPIPHYYPQGAAYAAAIIQLILTGDPVAAVQVTSGLALVGAGVALYSFVARRVGAAPALTANVLYVFSPYIALTAPHMLGDLPGVIAHALLPMLLWAADRLLGTQQPWDLAVVSTLGVALILTDIRYAIVGGALTLVYVVWYRGAIDRDAPWRAALTALFLAVSMTSFFWLPALSERNAVTWRVPVYAPVLTLSPANTLAPLRQTDPAELIPQPQFTLGVPVLVFTLASILWIGLARAWRSFFALFMICAMLLTAIALIWLPRETWLLGPISLCASASGGSAMRLLRRFPGRRRWLLAGLGSLVIITSTLPYWLFQYQTSGVINPNPAAQVQYELQGFGVAGLPPAYALPVTVAESLAPNRALVNSYAAGEIARVDTVYLNSNVQLGFLDQTSHSYRLQIQAYAPTSINLLTAYFPGWRASSIAGRLHLSQDADTGLIRLEVAEPLASDVTVGLETTAVRAASWGLSWSALAALLLISRQRARLSTASWTEFPLLTITEARVALAVWLGMVLLAGSTAVGALDALRTRPNQTLTITAPVRARTDAGLELTSARLDQQTYQAGDLLGLTIYWRALRFLEENYRVRVSLIDPTEDRVILATDFRHPGFYPTRRWTASRFVTDNYQIPLPAEADLTRYVLRVEAFVCAAVCLDEGRLSFFGETGTPLGTSLLLPTWIEVAP